VSACRWFDIDQDRFLRTDHLQLVLYSAQRERGRMDLQSLCYDVCKDEKFRYEAHI
jgi:hypothetical protein